MRCMNAFRDRGRKLLWCREIICDSAENEQEECDNRIDATLVTLMYVLSYSQVQ